MKKALLIAFIFFNLKAAAQDMIYLADGYMVPGKIIEITKDSVKFKNLANPGGPMYSYAVANVRLAFNVVGNYLVFSQASSFSDKERDDFIAGVAKPRPVDITIDINGDLSALLIKDEGETQILSIKNGNYTNFSKASLDFLIRKDGSHELFCNVNKALPYLVKCKVKIDSLLAHPPAAPPPTLRQGPTACGPDYSVPDMVLFGKEAIAKIQKFSNFLQLINAYKTNPFSAKRGVELASELFLEDGKNSHVEVLNVKAQENRKYLLRDYLNEVLIKAGKFDKVDIDYADIDYASEIAKGVDGNYYETVSFVQRCRGFIDGNLVYGDQRKLKLVIVLKFWSVHNAETMPGWHIYLGDIGIEETMKP